jgi:hypothetical protein
MKKLLYGLSVLLFQSSLLFAQSFEGEIEFVKKSSNETLKYIYHVKGDKVRIDEFNSENTLLGIMLLNTKTKEALSLNLERKLFIDLEKNNTKLAKIDGVEIIPGKGVKKVVNYSTKEITVKNSKDNSSVTYFVSKDHFTFFEPLLITLNRKDKVSIYYQQIPDIKDVFPFYAVERDANGKELTTLEVTQIVKRVVEDEMFKIPDGYSKL